jgi:hypothetical protein
MAHFAELDSNNTVSRVIVLNNTDINNLPFPASEPIGVDFCRSLYGENTIWRQTSYNNAFRVRYAGVGYSYDMSLDAFIPPKPYPSWTLDSQTADWTAPVPYPDDGKIYAWDENTLSWVLANPHSSVD